MHTIRDDCAVKPDTGHAANVWRKEELTGHIKEIRRVETELRWLLWSCEREYFACGMETAAVLQPSSAHAGLMDVMTWRKEMRIATYEINRSRWQHTHTPTQRRDKNAYLRSAVVKNAAGALTMQQQSCQTLLPNSELEQMANNTALPAHSIHTKAGKQKHTERIQSTVLCKNNIIMPWPTHW